MLIRRPGRSLIPRIQADFLLVLALTVAVGVGGWLVQARAAGQRAFRDHLSRLADTGLAAVETPELRPGILVDADAAGRRRFRYWAWTVMADPSVSGAALLDDRGQIMAIEPEDLGDTQAIADAVAAGAPAFDPGGGLDRLELVVGSGDGRNRVAVMAVPFRFSPLDVDGLWASLAACGVVAYAGMYWIRRRVNRLLIVPIRSLTTVVETGCRAPQDVLPSSRNDELGRLCRAIEQTLNERERSRNRVGVLERTMDERLSAQTRKIQATLRRAEQKAWIDALTKLGNRRLLDDRLEPLFADQVDRAEDMAIILFDIDNFKALNDTLGHAVGDELLAFTGELFRGALRSTDLGLRHGGDEFLVIMLGTGVKEASETAERLIKLFRQRASVFDVSVPVTLSAGVASIRATNPGTGSELMELADVALYESKRGGKGRVYVYHPAISTPESVRCG